MPRDSPFIRASPSFSNASFDSNSPRDRDRDKVFGSMLDTSMETYAKRLDKAILKYTELLKHIPESTEHPPISAQMPSSHPSSMEQARESKNSGQLSSRQYHQGLYAQKSTSRIRDNSHEETDLNATGVSPLISADDPFHPANFKRNNKRVASRVSNRYEEVFYEDWENQRPKSSKRVDVPPLKPIRRLDSRLHSDPGYLAKKLHNPPPFQRLRLAHSLDESPARHHYYDEDWWVHAKLHELPHVLKQMKKENREEKASLDLERELDLHHYRLVSSRKPLSSRNFSEELPDLQSPFIPVSKTRNSYSVVANRQELIAFIQNNCPMVKEVAKNVLNRKNLKNLVGEFQLALDRHADLLDKRILRLKKDHRRALGREWAELLKCIEHDERERDICRKKSNEIQKAKLRDDPFHHPVRPLAKTNMGSEINQLRLLQSIFDHS